ncbi:MAG: SURF1 family protein [Actinobacteria bacterium]|nr:SURF1 family protein [Actinomycetota bacterium]
MSRYAFALKPKWILGHAIVIAMVIGFVSAGFWQISRLHQREAYNNHVVANMEAPIAPVGEVLPKDADFATTTRELNRRVTATGRYLADQDILITAQASPDSIPGVWIVSPLLLADGRVLLVNRGWLPSTGTITRPPADTRPPSGIVTVVGLVSETQTKSEGESPETNHAYQPTFLRIDVKRIQRQFTQPLLPAFLLRQAQKPADVGSGQPHNLAVPELSSGPHLSYAIQWFAFTLLALLGYPMLIWLIGRERQRTPAGPIDPETLPEGAFVDEDGTIDMTAVPDASAALRRGDTSRR